MVASIVVTVRLVMKILFSKDGRVCDCFGGMGGGGSMLGWGRARGSMRYVLPDQTTFHKIPVFKGSLVPPGTID